MGDAIKMAIGSTEMGGWSTRLITINMNSIEYIKRNPEIFLPQY